jgi:hypothetical protein
MKCATLSTPSFTDIHSPVYSPVYSPVSLSETISLRTLEFHCILSPSAYDRIRVSQMHLRCDFTVPGRIRKATAGICTEIPSRRLSARKPQILHQHLPFIR